MTPTEKILNTMTESHLDLLSRTIELNARCDALQAAVALLAHLCGQDVAKIVEAIERTQNQSHSERLLRIEKTNPAIAAKLDRRQKHGEGLGDDIKIIQWPEDRNPES